MGHSYTNLLVHCVFSTKERMKLISPQWKDRLWAYMGGIARENGMRALAVGGLEDHAHILLLVPSPLAVSKSVQVIKAGSSKWIHDSFPKHSGFAWQEGYGAFSVGISNRDHAIRYITNQEEHHKNRSFQEEFLAFLNEHGIEYDERYVWG